MKINGQRINNVLGDGNEFVNDFIQQIHSRMIDTFGLDGFDEDDLNHALSYSFEMVEVEFKQYVNEHFAKLKLVDDVRELVIDFKANNISIQHFTNRLLNLKYGGDWTENNWCDFIQEQIWSYLKGADHVFNLNSSGNILEGLID